MGVSTISFVPIPDNVTLDVFAITKLARDGIREYLRSKLPGSLNPIEKMQESSVKVECSPELQMMTLDFNEPFLSGDKPRARNMHLHCRCHTDYSDVYLGPKIIMSLGCWGDSVALIRAAGAAIATGLGSKLYWTESDCSGENWMVELPGEQRIMTVDESRTMPSSEIEGILKQESNHVRVAK